MAAFAADLEPQTVSDFRPGLQTTLDSIYIEPGAAQDLQNVDVLNGRLQTRRGSILQNSTALGSYSSQAVRFIHEFPDPSGNFWLLSVSSASIYKSNDSGVTSTLLTSTHGVTTTSQFTAINAFGKCRLTDGTTNWIVFDGSNVTVSTASPKGKLSAFWLGRVWTADISGDRSTLYGSRQNDPEDWTDDGTTDADMYSIPVRKDDGYPITAIFPYRTMLVVFKPFSLDLLTSSDGGLTFTLTPISLGKGTQHPTSVQIVNGKLIFMADDGWYEFDGVSLINISTNIQDVFDSIQQNNATSRSYTATTQTDFRSGTTNYMSTELSPGSVVLSTWTASDTSSIDFSSGTSINIDSTTVSGQIQLTVNNNDPLNDSFESGNVDNWTLGGTGYTATQVPTTGGVSPQDGTAMVLAANSASSKTVYLQLLVSAGVIAQSSLGVGSSNANSWLGITLDSSAQKGREVQIRIKAVDNGTGDEGTVTSDAFLCSGGNISVQVYGVYSGGSNSYLFVDNVDNGRSTITSGTFTSRTFDTGFSSASWLPSSYTLVTNNHPNTTVGTQSSDNGTVWDSSVPWTSGSAPTSRPARYIRYVVQMYTGSAGVAQSYFADGAFSARSATGSWVSPSFSLGSIGSWGAFSEGSSVDGGSITYALYTDSDSTKSVVNGVPVSGTYISSQTVTNNNIPTVSTGSFGFFTAYHSITLSTQNPTTDTMSQAWYEGNYGSPMASIEHEGSYICAVSIDSQTVNDTMMVYDENGAWTKYKGMTAYSMAKYRQKPYYGSALQGYIYRFQVDDTYTDNLLPIDAYWISKDFDFGYPITDKTMQRYRITARRQPGTSVTFQYGVNKPTTYASDTLDLGSVSGFYRKNIVPTSLTYQKGVTHRVKFSNNASNQPFDILSFTLVPRLETAP